MTSPYDIEAVHARARTALERESRRHDGGPTWRDYDALVARIAILETQLEELKRVRAV
jgi:hypothetical protein